MTPQLLVTSALGITTLLATTLSQLELWQRKEYRFDRLTADITSPPLNYKVALAALYFVLAAAFLAVLPTLAIATAHRLALVALIAAALYFAWQINQRGLLRPQFTTKATLSLVLAAIIVALVTVFSPLIAIAPAIHWLVLLALSPLIVITAVALATATAYVKKRRIIAAAASKRAANTTATVVGITGSFGKTSTKHFASQLIPEAAVSREHRNSEFVIAQDLIAQLTANTTTYITELGAYKKGEIKALTHLTKPTIGVITNIGNQHLALFGSKQAIAEAKWELIESLPQDGIAILNADDPILKEKAKTHSGRIIWFSTENQADIYASDIKVEATTITATIHVDQHSERLTFQLLGTSTLSNVLAAIAIAHALKTPWSDIKKRLATITPPSQTVQLIKGARGEDIIDDAYSANEAGVLAAIKHLNAFPASDRRIITVPLIELGTDSKRAHRAIGKALATAGAKVYIYGTAHQADILAGVEQSGKTTNIKFFTHPAPLLKAALTDRTTQTVYLLEGRIPSIIKQQLMKNPESNLRPDSNV